jgi:PAS domain S-box-containing protein
MSEDLRAENAELRRRLAESEETLHAIRTGAVDAFVVEGQAGMQVYTLKTADRPYRLFVEHMQQGAATLQRDGTLVYVNARLAELLGAPQETLAGTPLAAFVAEEDRELFVRFLNAGAASATGGELRFARPFGGTLPVYLNLNPLTEDCGAAVGVLVTDLRSRRHHEQLAAAHQALRKRSTQFEALIARAPIGVFVVDADMRVEQMNPIAAPIFGDAPERLVGRDFGELARSLWERGYADELVAILRHTLATGEPYATAERSERRIDRGTLEVHEWRLDRMQLPDGRHGVVCYVRDISPQARERQEIAQSEERHRSLVSVITDVPWTADPEGGFVTEQEAWSAYTGQSWAELRGFGWLDAVHPEDREAVQELWQRARSDAAPYESRNRLWHQASGQWRRCIARAIPLRDAAGVVREWVGAYTDVEEREALLASERQARGDASRAARLKDEFLAIVSHELRSPLNAIVGYTHLLKRNAGDPRRTAEAIEIIERNTKLQTQLIDDLLDMSRIASGKLRLQGRVLTLRGVVDEALDAVRPLAFSKGIEIVVRDRAPGENVYGDGGRLQQVAWNLLSNAVKFTPRGGRVEVDLSRHGTEVELRVSDTGEGIDPEFLPCVFERFRQADSSSARKHGGLGLGLALVKQLTELHRGWVEAQSEGKGKGATFLVRLPLAEGGSDVDPGAREAEAVDLAGVSVLIVDDEPEGLELAKRILEDSGASVIEATGADEALAHLAARSVDVILSDIGMAVRDGYEFIRAVRRRNLMTPAAAVTAFVGAQDVERVFREGYQAHVGKPIEPARLVRTVALLSGRGARMAEA